MYTLKTPNYVVIKSYAESLTGSVSRSSIIVDCSKTVTGEKVPAFRRKIATLQNASSAYTKKYREIVTYDYSGKARLESHLDKPKRFAEQSWWGNWFAPKSVVPYDNHDNAVINLGTGRFYSKASDALEPFKGLVFAGELKESTNLIGQKLQQIHRLYGWRRYTVAQNVAQVRRYLRWRPGERARSTRRLLTDVSDQWLEYSFGIAPLLSDIESAAEALTREKVEVRTVKATQKGEPVKIFQSVGASFQMPGMTYTTKSLVTRQTDARFRGALSCKLKPTETGFLAKTQGFGLSIREFVPTVWELTPWSFLVDYFLNAQQTLNAVFYHDADWIYAVKTVKTSRKATYVTNWGIGPGDNTWGVVSCPAGEWRGSQEAVTLSRSNITTSDIGLRFRYPPLGTKWVNMLALAISSLRKQRRISLL
jgi:hypothetical protein